MLGYHSSLEADEIPYSWLVVYCQLSGLPSTRLLLERSQLAHCQLASQLPGYIPFISKTIGVPESKLINKHTTLPLFRCFLHESCDANFLNEDSSDADILRLLRDGRSLREATQHFKRSIIYVKKIAVQHNVQVDRRPKRIFGVDRELIIGMLKSGVKTHQIAHKVDCSVGAIEQILSQHPDIVECRQQMRFKAKCLEHQNCILSALSEHPDFHRGEIQRECRASYTWLFKHNQQWLYEHVPPAIPRQYRYQGRKNNQKNEH